MNRREFLSTFMAAGVAAAAGAKVSTLLLPSSTLPDPELLECCVELDADLIEICPDRAAYVASHVRLFIESAMQRYGRPPDRIRVGVGSMCTLVDRDGNESVGFVPLPGCVWCWSCSQQSSIVAVKRAAEAEEQIRAMAEKQFLLDVYGESPSMDCLFDD